MQKQILNLREFHTAFESAKNYKFSFKPEDVRLRLRLMHEELRELSEAIEQATVPQGKVDGYYANVVKETADLLYVVFGTAVALGYSDILEESFQEVHFSNMSKVGPNGSIVKDKHGKVLKPKTYHKANLLPIIQDKILDDSTPF